MRVLTIRGSSHIVASVKIRVKILLKNNKEVEYSIKEVYVWAVRAKGFTVHKYRKILLFVSLAKKISLAILRESRRTPTSHLKFMVHCIKIVINAQRKSTMSAPWLKIIKLVRCAAETATMKSK